MYFYVCIFKMVFRLLVSLKKQFEDAAILLFKASPYYRVQQLVSAPSNLNSSNRKWQAKNYLSSDTKKVKQLYSKISNLKQKFFLTLQNLKLFGLRQQHFLKDAFQSYDDFFKLTD